MKSSLVLALALALPLLGGWAGNQGTQASTPGGSAIAGLTGSANNVPMYTSATAAALLPVSVAAQGVIDDATVAAMLATLGGVPTTRTVSPGTGLSGGGDLSANRTLTLADTAVSPNTYGSASLVPVITVDAQGRITGVTTEAIGSFGAITATSLTTTNGVTITKTLSVGNSGTASFANASTSTVVTMAQTQPDATYHVTLTSVDATNGLPALYRITARSTTQFTVTYSLTTGSTAVTYLVTDYP